MISLVVGTLFYHPDSLQSPALLTLRMTCLRDILIHSRQPQNTCPESSASEPISHRQKHEVVPLRVRCPTDLLAPHPINEKKHFRHHGRDFHFFSFFQVEEDRIVCQILSTCNN